jgi:hypothetical protein
MNSAGAHNMTMMCDMHYGDMPNMGGRQTVGNVLMAGFMPDVQGRFQAVIQMKSPEGNSIFRAKSNILGENGMLVIGAFQFVVGTDVGVTNLTTMTGMSSMNMTGGMEMTSTTGGSTTEGTTATVPEPTSMDTMNMPTMTMADSTSSTGGSTSSTIGAITNLEDSSSSSSLSVFITLLIACILAVV